MDNQDNQDKWLGIVKRIIESAHDQERASLAGAIRKLTDDYVPATLEVEVEQMLANQAQSERPATGGRRRERMTTPKTPAGERKRQLEWMLAYLRDNGPTTVRELRKHMISEFPSIAARHNPNRTVSGRAEGAFRHGLVRLNGKTRDDISSDESHTLYANTNTVIELVRSAVDKPRVSLFGSGRPLHVTPTGPMRLT